MKTKKLSKSLQELMPEFELIQDFLVSPPTKHIVRGLLFDRTSDKNVFYIYMLIVPLFAPVMPNLSLNYSKRLTFSNNVPIVVKFHDGVATFDPELLSHLECEIIPLLRSLESVEKFLSYNRDIDLDRQNIKLEIAIAHYLAGEIAVSKKILCEIKTLNMPILPLFQEIRVAADAALAAIDDGAKIDEIIRKNEERNTEVLFKHLSRINGAMRN